MFSATTAVNDGSTISYSPKITGIRVGELWVTERGQAAGILDLGDAWLTFHSSGAARVAGNALLTLASQIEAIERQQATAQAEAARARIEQQHQAAAAAAAPYLAEGPLATPDIRIPPPAAPVVRAVPDVPVNQPAAAPVPDPAPPVPDVPVNQPAPPQGRPLPPVK
jgi:hypothetical protein